MAWSVIWGTAAAVGWTVMVSVAVVFAAIAPRIGGHRVPEIVGVTPGTDVVAVTFEPIFCGSVSVTVTPVAASRPVVGDRHRIGQRLAGVDRRKWATR